MKNGNNGNAQEVQEIITDTTAPAPGKPGVKELLDAVPEDTAQTIKDIAAYMTGKPADSFTLEAALQGICAGDQRPHRRAFTEKTAQRIMDAVPTSTWLQLYDKLEAAAESGQLIQTAIDTLQRSGSGQNAGATAAKGGAE